MFRKFVNSPRIISQVAKNRFSFSKNTIRNKHFYVYVEQDDFFVPIEEDEPLSEIMDVYRSSSFRGEHTSSSASFLSRNLMRQNHILSQIIDKDLVTDVEQFLAEEKDVAALGSVKCNNTRPQILIRRNNRKENKKFLRSCEAQAKAASTEGAEQAETAQCTTNASATSSAATAAAPTTQEQTTTSQLPAPTAAATSTRNNNDDSCWDFSIRRKDAYAVG